LITDSEFTRQEILQHFTLPDSAVSAVHLACAEDFRPRSEREVFETLRNHGLRHRGYTFFSGTIEPRKNLDHLIDTYGRLPKPLRLEYPLVLCGHRGWKSEDIHVRIQRAQSEGWLHYLGYIDEATLPVLYSGARLFVFPSLYEGFGLPVLEAMASATPVICATSASLPEVAGDAAAMFDPLDVETLSDLLQQGLEDAGWQDAARARGLDQATRFTWRRCAQETARIYHLIQPD
jgi:alpha-1,3-rhamnosyl/mannosyltransferase